MNIGGGIELGQDKYPEREEIISAARELCESGEVFQFPGIDPDAQERMMEQEQEPETLQAIEMGFASFIKDLIPKFEAQGIKIVPKKFTIYDGDFFVIPAQSNNIELDSISPGQLQINGTMPENLKKLITLVRIMNDFA